MAAEDEACAQSDGHTENDAGASFDGFSQRLVNAGLDDNDCRYRRKDGLLVGINPQRSKPSQKRGNDCLG